MVFFNCFTKTEQKLKKIQINPEKALQKAWRIVAQDNFGKLQESKNIQ